MSAELGRLNQEQALKKEHALVKQINDAYDARKRTIRALDEKASRNLKCRPSCWPSKTKRTGASSGKNRSAGNDGEPGPGCPGGHRRQKTPENAGLSNGSRRKNAVKKAEAPAKAEQIQAHAGAQSSPAAAGVKNLDTKQFYKQADAFKNAEAALKQWQELAAKKKKLEKEIADALFDRRPGG